jgi:non-ribosomal peptide synthetase component E (peptide arylation enzyme)
LATYKRPAAIEVLDQLPKDAVGKIDSPSCAAGRPRSSSRRAGIGEPAGDER